MTEQEYWDTAAKSDNVRNEWICDKNVTDKQCLHAIEPYLKAGNVLDLGCGIGRLTMGYGTDISPEMLKIAKQLNPGNKYKLCDGRTLPYPDSFFDNVFSVFMFQHIPDDAKEAYVKEVYRVLAPKGIFRLQYVRGDEQAPFSYQTRGFDTGDFILKNTQMGLIHKEWVWLTLQK